MPKQRGLLMYCSDSLTSSVVASVVEMQCRQLCAPKTSSMTSLTGPAPFGITISRRAVVRRTRHSNVRCPDIFRFVEIASNRTRIVFAAKKSQIASSQTEPGCSSLPGSLLSSVDDRLSRPWARPSQPLPRPVRGRLCGACLPASARLSELNCGRFGLWDFDLAHGPSGRERACLISAERMQAGQPCR